MTGSGEVDEHHVEIRERRARQSRAVEERVDASTDLLDRGGGRIGITEVGRLVARHVDRRLLQVEHVDLGAHLRQSLDRGGAHPGPTAAAHDDPLALVTELRHLRPPRLLSGTRLCLHSCRDRAGLSNLASRPQYGVGMERGSTFDSPSSLTSRSGSSTFFRFDCLYGTRLSRCVMMLRRARFLSFVCATYHGAQAVSVAANISSRARE